MGIDLAHDQELLSLTTRKFLEAEGSLGAVRDMADGALGPGREWWRRGADLGWAAMLVPEEYGGGTISGDGLLDLVLVAEEMGRLVAPGPLLPVNVVAAALAGRGTGEQKASVLPALVAGEMVAAWCFAEPGGGWDVSRLSLEAAPSDGGFRLDGVKAPVEAAGEADLFLVTARTGDGLTQLLVPAGSAGITVASLDSLDLGKRFGRVSFQDVEVPSACVVGEVGGAVGDVERQFQIAVVLQCAETMGATARVMEFTLDYMFDRYSFGRPLASYQALKHRFADMRLWLEACQATTAGCARAVQAESDRASELVSVAAAYVGEKTPEIVQDCVQMHGGIGVTWEHDLHLYLRRVALNRMMYGAPHEHRDRLARLIGF